MEREARIAAYVTSVFESPDQLPLPFHNLHHVRNVVERSTEVARHYLLGEQEEFILLAAAWFHDIGQLFGPVEGHEERGVIILENYLQTDPLPGHMSAAVVRCILATRPDCEPVTFLERVIRDADTYHLGTPMFRITNELLKKELEGRTGEPQAGWSEKSMAFLEAHTFYTSYCRQMLDPGKQENLAWLESILNGAEQKG